MLKDPSLSALAKRLNLEPSSSASEWEARLRDRIPGPRYAAFQSLREVRKASATRASLDTLSADVDFYRFVGEDATLFRLMLEGRLGYYDAVLPRVAEIVAQASHDLIVDLGSHGGLGTLYLGRRFPESQVIGIERCAEAVGHARLFQVAAGVPNVEFVHGDYTDDVAAAGVDVVLSLQTMPTYLLPRVPSVSPESYLRGQNLARAADDPYSPVQILARSVLAVRQMCRAGGRVILHERMRDFPFAALFHYLACRARLGNGVLQAVTWQAANERDGDQTAPLLVTKAQHDPASLDERAVLDFYLPPVALPPLSGPEVQRGLMLTGPQAQFAFTSFANQRRDVRIEIVMKEGLQFNVHLGATNTGLVYTYTCTSLDFRELKMCDAAYRRQLFQLAVDYINQARNAAEVSSVSPDPATLQAQLEAIG